MTLSVSMIGGEREQNPNPGGQDINLSPIPPSPGKRHSSYENRVYLFRRNTERRLATGFILQTAVVPFPPSEIPFVLDFDDVSTKKSCDLNRMNSQQEQSHHVFVRRQSRRKSIHHQRTEKRERNFPCSSKFSDITTFNEKLPYSAQYDQSAKYA